MRREVVPLLLAFVQLLNFLHCFLHNPMKNTDHYRHYRYVKNNDVAILILEIR